MKTEAQYFWENVLVHPRTECWVWAGSALNPFGYGQYRFPKGTRKPRTAHRASWTLHNGPIPPRLCVLHRCDNPRCVNPEHLFLGTQAENMRDMVLKGRSLKGERANGSKLTDNDVREIRSNKILTLAELASKYGISLRNVYYIVTQQTWRHVS